MDFLTYECPICRKMLKIPLQFAGRSGKCNHCQSHIVVPAFRQQDPPPIHPELDRSSISVKQGIGWALLASTILSCIGNFHLTGELFSAIESVLSVGSFEILFFACVEFIGYNILTIRAGVLAIDDIVRYRNNSAKVLLVGAIFTAIFTVPFF